MEWQQAHSAYLREKAIRENFHSEWARCKVTKDAWCEAWFDTQRDISMHCDFSVTDARKQATDLKVAITALSKKADELIAAQTTLVEEIKSRSVRAECKAAARTTPVEKKIDHSL